MAIALARQGGRALRLLHVRPAQRTGTTADLVLVDDGRQTRFRLRSDCYLEQLARRLEQRTGIDVSVETVAGMDVAQTLREEVARGVELLVLSRRSWPGRSWPWGETVVESLVRKSPVPLVIVPETMGAADFAEGRVERVLLPIRGNVSSRQAVDGALKLAGEASDYWLLSVIPLWALAQTHRAGGGTTAAMASHALTRRNEAWFHLNQAQRKLRRVGKRTEATVLFDELSPGPAIVSHAEYYGADLVALTSRPTVWPKWFTRSVSRYVACHSTIPVLICPKAD
jgi:nucleotide-binding universal stress UspA family protein